MEGRRCCLGGGFAWSISLESRIGRQQPRTQPTGEDHDGNGRERIPSKEDRESVRMGLSDRAEITASSGWQGMERRDVSKRRWGKPATTSDSRASEMCGPSEMMGFGHEATLGGRN